MNNYAWLQEKFEVGENTELAVSTLQNGRYLRLDEIYFGEGAFSGEHKDTCFQLLDARHLNPDSDNGCWIVQFSEVIRVY